jgi:1,4-alpha-glucan branching enzyme
MGNMGGVHAEQIPVHGRPFSLNLTLPPLGALFFKAT